MSSEVFIDILEKFGFPVVVCIALLLVVYKFLDRYIIATERLSELISNNNLLIQKVLTILNERK